MTHMIHARSASILAIAAALAFAPSTSHAQTGPFVGVGAGAGRVANNSTSKFAPSLHLRAGWGISPTVAVMLEGTMNGIGGGNPDRNGPGQLADSTFNFSSRQLRTGAILASVQLGNPQTLYVRPGVGLAAHAFTAWHPLPADGYEARTSYEPGLAAGIAVGRRVGLVPGLPLSVEGVAQWTGGEDSTNPRWSAGVQFVSNLRL